MTDRPPVGRSRTGRRARGGRGMVAAAWLVALGLAFAGCGTSTTSPGSAGTATPLPTDSTEGPSATTWPTLVVEGAISLAAADASFKQMNTDVTTAVNAGDPQKILIVMKDALTFLQKNRVAVRYLQEYDSTKATGDKIGAAYDQMIKGAQAIVDGITSGDGEAVQQGFNDFFAGDAAYAEQTGPLGDLAAQAALMKRSYTQ
jgi:FlaG/FlaF family flagellin (archaellin)